MHSPKRIKDEIYMKRCLQLAQLGQGQVAPNPMVGAVLVYNEQIIGEGYHKKYGEPHAEVNCILNAIEKGFENLVDKSVLYVSLEPCSHFGKTPPCTDLILKYKIPEVVVGSRDTFEKVNGTGIEKLKNAEISVVEGILESECIALNKRFFSFHKNRLPYIILKWAQTADEFIGNANNERLMITNGITQRLVHQWRSHESAILVGTNTALKDDPKLTNRLWTGKNPLRLVTDFKNQLQAGGNIFSNEATTIIFNYDKHTVPGEMKFPLFENKTYWFKLKGQQSTIVEMLEACYQLKIQSLLVEGGARLQQSFIDEGYWNEARVITNPEMFIEKGIKTPAFLKNAALFSRQQSGNDSVSYFHPKNQKTF